MRQTIVQVDAFTDRRFAGNPAAVCVMEKAADERWMQQLADEMNLAETAFVYPLEHGQFSLRWFTPRAEVDLCGHATLAAAHVLWETGRLGKDHVARFQTRSGLLTAQLKGDWIELDFPATPARSVGPSAPLAEVLAAMDVATVHIARSRFDYLVELESEAAVRSFTPDINKLKRVDCRGLIVTARAGAKTFASDGAPFDFISRFFAPQVGIDEDPVTGSAHCALGPWWQARMGKDAFLAYQASRRGGTVRVTMRGERVLLGGQAVTTLRGELV